MSHRQLNHHPNSFGSVAANEDPYLQQVVAFERPLETFDDLVFVPNFGFQQLDLGFQGLLLSLQPRALLCW